MESAFIEIADGNLVAMTALTKMSAVYGEETMLCTLLPCIQRKGLKGKALADLYEEESKNNAAVCAVLICPLLCVRKNASGPTPVFPLPSS